MAGSRRKNPVASRRRVDDEGEDEEDSLAGGLDNDSLSEGSVLSNVDDDADADAEGSEASDLKTPKRTALKRRNGNKRGQRPNGASKPEAASAAEQPIFIATADTVAMMNGLTISGDIAEAEGIDFDDSARAMTEDALLHDPAAPAKAESLMERRRREHEEYKQKKEADPAFVPNRGGFFMHDSRSAGPHQNGFRPSVRGRGRGRGGIGGPFSPVTGVYPVFSPADAPWAHDLHETLAQPENVGDEPTIIPYSASGIQPKAAEPLLHTLLPNRLFSKTTHIGNVQMKVFLEGMKDPIVFSEVPINRHTRLPHHRPPLRRDKPVRISLPNHPPRYIFPAMDRSFIFIPRALRPNQQGFGRGRGRGSYGGYGSFPSGRTSAYGGSVYSPSIAMSRRSSMARDMQREGMVSPAGSVMSRNRSGFLDSGRPVVRLPPALDPASYQPALYSASPVPVVNLPMPMAYPLPQKPLSQESRPSSLTMYQPRPQKTVSVADIESPATLNFHPPQQQQQQPFHHQVPTPVNGQIYTPDPHMYPHSRRPSQPSQRGTPLSQIPERAIHAQPFQPYPYQPAPAFYPQQYPPPVYYYPPPSQSLGPTMGPPAFVPGQQYAFMVQAAPPPPAPSESTTQPGTVAHESNGMVYYYDSSQLAANMETPTAYPTMAYAPSNGYIIPQPAVFYPPQ